MSMKNSNDTIGNRTRDLPALAQCLNQLCHSVPHCRDGIKKNIHSVAKTVSFIILKQMVYIVTSLFERFNRLSDSDRLKRSPGVLMIFRALQRKIKVITLT